ncbi:MAG TPA: ribosomal protein S18-alanine N-acetyltransferase [Thermoanaerobaculia bacterium]|nr:ribosomal protein S18-alanine N-acetyltransferase [Thermoanaerobaculia bacterium]
MTTAPPLTVRLAQGRDLLRIAELETLSFPEPWPVDLLAFELAHPRAILLTASRGSAPAAGYAVFRHVAGEAELLRVGVAPEERRQGIARSLIEDGIARLRREGVEVCHLEVRTTNPAILLYEAIGFERTGLRRRYYQDGTDALVMSRRLSRL